MKIFIDSADTYAIARALDTGLVDGVTTNPTLIMKSGRKPEDVYDELVKLGVPDISMEVYGTADEMIAEGRRLDTIYGDAATIKVPMSRDGLEACRVLSQDGIRVNVTLIFCIPQAILAAKAGAYYVSPFVGRLDDQSVSGLEVVRGIAGLYQQKGIQTQVLAASIRSVHRAVRSWYNGASVVTMPPAVFEGMWDHILTDQGLEIFDNDIKQIK